MPSQFKKLSDHIRRFFARPVKRVPFRQEWGDYLKANLPLYAALPQDLRIRLNDKISEFIPRVYWEGAKGLELTGEMVAAIAAQACLLTLNMTGNPYSGLRTVIVFPKAFIHEGTQSDRGGTLTDRRHRVSGLSYSSGTISLAWEETEHGGRIMNDGYNVVFHEFAHQLDQADGYSNGAPILRRPQDYAEWNRVMRKEFDRLVDASANGRASILDPYGATDPAEFFAVATEAFFEKAGKLNKYYPDLYAIMRHYYQLDPVLWR